MRDLSWFFLCLFLLGLAEDAGANEKTIHHVKALPAEVCRLLTFPGDIGLDLPLGETGFGVTYDGHFSEKTWVPDGSLIEVGIGLKEVASLTWPGLRYIHSKILQKIFWPGRLAELEVREDEVAPLMHEGQKSIPEEAFVVSISDFAPGNEFLVHKNLLTKKKGVGQENFAAYEESAVAIYTRRGPHRHREKALKKLLEKDYHGFGVCSDYVNWLYNDNITYWWNQIPLLKQGIEKVVPIWNLHTPDDLARSPNTRKVCVLGEEEELLYPKKTVNLKRVVKRLNEGLRSSNAEIRSHSLKALVRLVELEAAVKQDLSYRALFDQIQFHTE